MNAAPAAPTSTAPKKKNCVVAINEELHGRLRDKAKREGLILQRMVEAKLAELVPAASPLEVVK